ncbi:hypothetical protein [Leptospira noguchii]|uniref:hypothetical protein n=1 Tax=Leptospira noguchii TaxID=28182 RepID=UPI001FB727B8|nr:hypothetical protein [Leptospira noguchii]UOG36293.1 hypothetical protein MAL02_19265 [Leptospira noguchii]
MRRPLTGMFAGKYEVQYKHFDSVPRNENGEPLKAGDSIKAGQKIGDLERLKINGCTFAHFRC